MHTTLQTVTPAQLEQKLKDVGIAARFVPIPEKSKAPYEEGWHKTRYTSQDLPQLSKRFDYTCKEKTETSGNRRPGNSALTTPARKRPTRVLAVVTGF